MKIKPVIIGISMLIMLSIASAIVKAQEFIFDWSNPEVIFSTPRGQKSNELWVLADLEDILYMWWPVFDIDTEKDTAKNSLKWTLHTQMIDGKWRSPLDVLVWPDAGRLTSVIVDNSGLLHGFSATDCVSYVNAQRDESMSAHAWGDSVCLDQTGLTNPSVVQDQDGTIYVMYAAIGNQSLRLVKSNNGAATWSPYITVVEDDNNFLLDPMMAIDDAGSLHVVWSVGLAPDAYPPVGVFYSRSDDEGESWTVPVQLGGLDEGQPAIAVHEDDVHVVWNGDAVKRGRYYRFSGDSGNSWGSVEALSPQNSQGGRGGLQRPPAIVVDNLGKVHVLLHEQESLFYSSKLDQDWTPKQSLFIPEVMKAVEVYATRLAITNGNILHAFYILESYDQLQTEDPSDHIWRIFHQSKQINSTVESPILWPTGEHNETLASTNPQDALEVAEAKATRPPTIEIHDSEIEGRNNFNPAWSFYVAVTSVTVFIALFLVLTYFKYRR
jgi:hypothetical protein